jgi:hypothetical protein
MESCTSIVGKFNLRGITRQDHRLCFFSIQKYCNITQEERDQSKNSCYMVDEIPHFYARTQNNKHIELYG